MTFRFRKHYSVNEAEALLPQITEWLCELLNLREELERVDQILGSRLETGADIGGQTVNERVRTIVRFQGILTEFHTREIQLKDLDRGLIDFPHLRAGREVFLCWEKGEDSIGYWHETDSGFAGRELL